MMNKLVNRESFLKMFHKQTTFCNILLWKANLTRARVCTPLDGSLTWERWLLITLYLGSATLWIAWILIGADNCLFISRCVLLKWGCRVSGGAERLPDDKFWSTFGVSNLDRELQTSKDLWCFCCILSILSKVSYFGSVILESNMRTEARIPTSCNLDN